ncbi:hypothetical protein ACFLIN_09640 [Corynebacterium kutscheri]|uniref:hypothetical protein n=1 Tax=Corynebacterium kutscheri TaxID=35755 RepID=UPI0037BF4125
MTTTHKKIRLPSPITDTVILNPGAHIFLRPHALQFGMDATRSGIVELPDYLCQPLVHIFHRLRQPMRKDYLLDQLGAIGMDRYSAKVLLNELLTLGVLHSCTQLPHIAVIGRGVATTATIRLLSDLGFPIIRLNAQENTALVLANIDPDTPLVLINELIHMAELANIVGKFTTIIPANIIDGRILIGPTRIHGTGPCPYCLVLRLHDQDPYWHEIMSQKTSHINADPLTHIALASQVCALVANLYLPTPAPGLPTRTIKPHRLIHFGAYGHGSSWRIMSTHPLCVECFNFRQQQTQPQSLIPARRISRP